MDKRLIEAVELFEDVMVFGTERVLRDVEAEVWQEYSREQIQVLKLLNKNGPLPAGAIAELQCVHRSAISNRLKKLEEKGLIEIAKAEGDHRSKLVSLTQHGRAVVKESDQAVYDYIEALFADQVEDEELDQFLQMFKKIKHILKLEGERK
ncbi:MarR family transcriptional regulator [Rossellomorea marisflavi]|uniref:MarR family transcriptional regulator n=1 Tax=Rossellomorea marisflavi TaxID=189381 RepID=A0A0M0G0P2_9BACI|nr:MarR family transcriptional regulator [Rossellomorea marisflavi]KON83172.1 MarR family transcriptional regulator [Rossellomorea marisflavi]UTE73098.1 MarR family transcriptional regulator [Rossellomorea marisflavi]